MRQFTNGIDKQMILSIIAENCTLGEMEQGKGAKIKWLWSKINLNETVTDL